jgi:hypothetical protein
MIIDKEESEDLAKLLDEVIEFIEQTEKEQTNVGMKLYDKCNDWLVKLGK